MNIILVSVKVSADQTESIQRDVVFLMDSSDEMKNDFQAVIGFVERMVAKLDVEENKDRVSVVQYSREPSVDFFLNTYKTQQHVAGNVGILRPKGGRPLNTGAALQYVKDNVFTASSGSRHQQGVPQILVLLTGGRSSDDVRNAVENLKGIGVMVYVVGTKNADHLEIQSISQEASRAFFAADSSDLADIEQQIFSAIAIKRGETPAIKPVSHGKTVTHHVLYCMHNFMHCQISIDHNPLIFLILLRFTFLKLRATCVYAN